MSSARGVLEPRVKSSRTTPIDAPTSMNSRDTSGGRTAPITSPTIRYTGIGEISNAATSRASAASTEQEETELEQNGRDLAAATRGERRHVHAPRSSFTASPTAGARADEHSDVAGLQREVRAWRDDRLVVTNDRNDRGSGA